MNTSVNPFDPKALRADFPILDTRVHGDKPLVYLDNAATTQRPRQVVQRISDFYTQQYSNVHRGIHALSEQSTDLYEQAREAVARFIHARHPHEVVFTSGTTAAINLVAHSWGQGHIQSGDEILLTLLEHHSNIVPWQQLAERTGATIRFVPVEQDGQLQLSQLSSLLNERTRIVSLTAASNVLGSHVPVKDIVAQAHSAGALVLLDAAQSAPHQMTDVQASGVDFLAFSGHKMLGPSGIGVLYGREELLEEMPPFLGGGSMIRSVTTDGFEPGELPEKFEAGTPPIAPAIGLTTAIEYLEGIGIDAIQDHEKQLVVEAHQCLSSLEGVRILGPPTENKGPIVNFLLDGIHPHDAAQALDQQGVAVRAGHHCAMPLHQHLGVTATLRASFYLYNTQEEVKILADAIVDTQRVFRRDG